MSTITNLPIKSLGSYTIVEIDTFSADQTRNVPMDRQFTPVTNVTKVSFAELWSTITTTWASETRTWLDTGSIIENVSHRNLGSYTIDELAGVSVEQLAGVSFDRQFTPITN